MAMPYLYVLLFETPEYLRTEHYSSTKKGAYGRLGKMRKSELEPHTRTAEQIEQLYYTSTLLHDKS